MWHITQHLDADNTDRKEVDFLGGYWRDISEKVRNSQEIICGCLTLADHFSSLEDGIQYIGGIGVKCIETSSARSKEIAPSEAEKAQTLTLSQTSKTRANANPFM